MSRWMDVQAMELIKYPEYRSRNHAGLLRERLCFEMEERGTREDNSSVVDLPDPVEDMKNAG